MNTNKIQHIIYVSLFAITGLVTTACTEKIDLKLNSTDPIVTIEGNISDKPGPYYVFVTNSKVYYQDNTPVPITGASVIISDNAGNIDTLTEVLGGVYQTNTLQGVVGRTYTLQVTTNAQLFTSTCTMHEPVDIDSLSVIAEPNGGGFGGGGNEGDNHFVICHVKDPGGIENSYRLMIYKSNNLQTTNDVHNDRLWDGKVREFRVDNGVEPGDSVRIELLSIDKSIYTYFSELSLNGNPFLQPAAPANPTSNISNNALGYFSAHSVKAKDIIIP